MRITDFIVSKNGDIIFVSSKDSLIYQWNLNIE